MPKLDVKVQFNWRHWKVDGQCQVWVEHWVPVHHWTIIYYPCPGSEVLPGPELTDTKMDNNNTRDFHISANPIKCQPCLQHTNNINVVSCLQYFDFQIPNISSTLFVAQTKNRKTFKVTNCFWSLTCKGKTHFTFWQHFSFCQENVPCVFS